MNGNREVSQSSYQKLKLTTSKVTTNDLSMNWKKVKGVSKYLIYGTKCGTKYRYLTSKKGESYMQKKLSKGTYYKYLVVAVDKNGKKLTTSKAVYVATKGGKNANVKSIKVRNSKISLKKNKSLKLKTSTVLDGKKQKMFRRISYESSNAKVASVSGNGTIKAKKKGKATIYVYAQNGLAKKVSVTVR